jgi:hypothetical protein
MSQRVARDPLAHPGYATLVQKGVAGPLIQAAFDANSERSPVDKVFDNFGQTYRDWQLRDRGFCTVMIARRGQWR